MSCPRNMILSVIVAVLVVCEGVVGTVLVPIEEILGYTTPSSNSNDQQVEGGPAPTSNLQLLVPLVMAAQGDPPRAGLRMGGGQPNSEEGQEVFRHALSKLIGALHGQQAPAAPTLTPFSAPLVRPRPRRPLRPVVLPLQEHDSESCPACAVLKALQSLNVQALMNRVEPEPGTAEESEEQQPTPAPRGKRIIHIHTKEEGEGETCIMCLLGDMSGRRQGSQQPQDVGPMDEPKPKHKGPIP